MSNYIYVKRATELSELVGEIKGAKYVGLDTEFERRNTFYPKPALLQFQINAKTYILDPLAFSELDGLFRALSASKVLMHACREDLEVFRVISDHLLTEFYDSQVAASLLGFDTQLSYQKLVKELLDKDLPKGETRSDWLQRPLSDSQIDYAIDDVLYLESLHTLLMDQLSSKRRRGWYEQELIQLRSLAQVPTTDEYFYKMKGLGRFNAQQIQTAYDLVLWREELARSKDIPRGFIIKDKPLLQICAASKGGMHARKLQALDDVPSPFVRKYAETVSALIAEPKVSEASEKAIQTIQRQVPESSKALKKELKSFRDARALELDIKPEVLLSNRLLDSVLHILYFGKMAEDDFLVQCQEIINPWRMGILEEKWLKFFKQLNQS